jgi:hypothetical protein
MGAQGPSVTSGASWRPVASGTTAPVGPPHEHTGQFAMAVRVVIRDTEMRLALSRPGSESKASLGIAPTVILTYTRGP